MSSAWTSSTDYASAMDSLFPRTSSGLQFKDAKGVYIFMRDIQSLSFYPQ